MNTPNRQSEAFFEARYRESSDPWQFASSGYELARYQATLEALSQATYRRGFEPGCSIGVLTVALAGRCQHLIACDIAPSALASARQRCKGLSHVDIIQHDVGDEPPEGPFDLIVFSELGYYFPADRLSAVARRLASRLAPGGEFVAVHWLGHSPDHLLHGDEVHRVLADDLPCEWLGGSRHEGFRIDSWRQVS